MGKGTECWSLSMLDPLILYILASCMIILAFGMAATTSHMRKPQPMPGRQAGAKFRFVLWTNRNRPTSSTQAECSGGSQRSCRLANPPEL